MISFAEAARWARRGPDRWGTTVDPVWHQGRGAFGGLLAGAAIHALEDQYPERPLRTLHIHFAAPARGALTLALEPLRTGNNVSHHAARITDADGVVVCFATAVLAASRRETLRYDHAEMPAVPPFAETPRHPYPPDAPRFVEHFDVRHVLGAPFSGLPDPQLGAWIALAEPTPTTPAVIAGLVDALPAGACALMPGPRPIASVDFTLRVLDPTLRPYAPHLLTVRSAWCDAGYTEETRELWTEDGRRVAQCHQLIALL